jgi:hypothetical protein
MRAREAAPGLLLETLRFAGRRPESTTGGIFMKARATLLAIPMMVGIAVAQSGAPQDQAKPPEAQAKPPEAQAGSTSGTPAAGMSGQPAEMKTTTYRGTLVDLACGSAAAPAAAPASAAGQPESTTAASGSANRSSGSECPATANSQTLGLKMDNGQTVRFDLVGNQRAQDALKTNKGWNKNLTENKPLKVKIHGVQMGDKLIVSSIN